MAYGGEGGDRTHATVARPTCLANRPLYLLGTSPHEKGTDMVPLVEPSKGFEPSTYCVRNNCSTFELRRQIEHRLNLITRHVGTQPFGLVGAMAGAAGIEPALRESKSRALPFGYTPKNEAHAASSCRVNLWQKTRAAARRRSYRNYNAVSLRMI